MKIGFVIGAGLGLALALAGTTLSRAADADGKKDAPMTDTEQAFRKNIAINVKQVTIKPGVYPTASGPVTVKEGATFTVEPAETVKIKDEPLTLPVADPKAPAFFRGKKLKALDAHDINALGSLAPGSVTIRIAPGGAAGGAIGGTKLAEGKDYVLDADWGSVERGPKADLPTTATVYASYTGYRMRVDSVVVDAAGKPALLRGTPHITVPLPPEAPAGASRLMNIWRPYGELAVKAEDCFPVIEPAASAPTASKGGLIPKTLAKLRAGQPVKIVCWGDSVTAGGNSSTPEMNYVNQFARLLKAKFPGAPITVENISVGGSASAQWLRTGPFNEEFAKQQGPAWAKDVDFERVMAAKPDLVSIEFVNDAGLPADLLPSNYELIQHKLAGLGAEMILITPHFTAVQWMPAKDVRTPEVRPYVQFLHDFSTKNNIAVADAAARWAHLWREGIPYVTLLDNSVNHPDDRGHRLFAEELMKCFE